MRHVRTLRMYAVLGLGATLALVGATAASAGQIFHETFHEETTGIETDFCGVPGLTVEFATVEDGRVHAVPHGKAGLAYFGAHVTRTETVTNLANGKSVTSFAKFVDKDLRVTDNGDGTLTLLILTTGNAVLYGPDGRSLPGTRDRCGLKSSLMTAARPPIRATTSSWSSSAWSRNQRAEATTSAKRRFRS